MAHAKVSSLNLEGVLVFLVYGCIMLSPAVAPVPASAQQLPVLFDANERLPRPDLSTLLRLRFLTTTDFPPFNFADQTGRLAGFHVELAREICAELDIEAKCQIQAMPYADLEKALSEGQGEAVIAGVGVTTELRRRFSFSRPFMQLPARFVRNAGVDIPGGEVAGLAGRPVGVVTGTAHEAMLKAFFPDIRATGFTDRGAMLQALKEKKVDAVFADALQLSFWTAGEASGHCCTMMDGAYVSEKFLGEGLTIMLRQDEEVLTAAIDSALAAISRDGRLQEIYLRYFPNSLY